MRLKVATFLIGLVFPADSNTLEEKAAVIIPSRNSTQVEEGCVSPRKDILVEHQQHQLQGRMEVRKIEKE